MQMITHDIVRLCECRMVSSRCQDGMTRAVTFVCSKLPRPALEECGNQESNKWRDPRLRLR